MNRTMKLQRFAEPLPVTEPGSETDLMNLPPLTPRTGHMPSSVAPEAWHNVEELLVTLSNSIRVRFSALEERFTALENTVDKTLSSVQGGVSRLDNTMGEFKQILQDATVEVDALEAQKNERQKEDRDSVKGGYLSRRGGFQR